MKKILLSLVTLLTIVSCGCNPKSDKQVGASESKQAVTESVQSDVTEVIYFHGKKRCISCNAIENLSKEVVKELANEKIVMKIVDISKAENKEIAAKYEVSWSSIILDKGGKIDNLTKMGFKYAKTKPEEFKTKLKEALVNISK